MTPGVARWFDGQQWTTRTAPNPVAQTPVAQTPVAQTPVASAPTMWTPQPLPAIGPVSRSYGTAGAEPAPSPAFPAPNETGHGRLGYGAADPYGAAQTGQELGYSRTGYGQGAYGQGAYGQGAYGQNPDIHVGLGEAGRSERRTAIGTLVAGLAVLVAAALSLRFASGQGGVIWTGGFVVGTGLLIRAAVAGRAARENGSQGLGALAWTGAGVVALVCAGLVVTSLTTIFQPALPTEPEVGSCFVDRGAEVELVRCADEHDLVALELAATINECPFATTAYVEDAGLIVCMGPDTGTSSS